MSYFNEFMLSPLKHGPFEMTPENMVYVYPFTLSCLYLLGPIMKLFLLGNATEGLILFGGLVSFVSYHMCTNANLCYLSKEQHYNMDISWALLSLLVVSSVYIFNIRPRRWKHGIYWLFGFLVSLFNNSDKPMWSFIGLLVGSILIPLIIYRISCRCQRSLYEEYEDPIITRTRWLSIIVTLGSSITMFFMSLYSSDYYSYHLIWHVLIFHVVYLVIGPDYWTNLYYCITNTFCGCLFREENNKKIKRGTV